MVLTVRCRRVKNAWRMVRVVLDIVGIEDVLLAAWMVGCRWLAGWLAGWLLDAFSLMRLAVEGSRMDVSGSSPRDYVQARRFREGIHMN